MDPATDSAETNRAAITLVLRGAKRPKLMKMAASQNTRIAKSGHLRLLLVCSNSSHRAVAILPVAWSAADFNQC